MAMRVALPDPLMTACGRPLVAALDHLLVTVRARTQPRWCSRARRRPTASGSGRSRACGESRAAASRACCKCQQAAHHSRCRAAAAHTWRLCSPGPETAPNPQP
eukprot:1424932-Prymnesium_polylepis.1